MKKKFKNDFTEAGKKKYGIASVDDWLKEAIEIRESGLYPDKPGIMKKVKKGQEYKNRPYCDHYVDQDQMIKGVDSHIDPKQIPVLNEAYAKRFVGVVEKRLVMAGLRLAAILDEIADKRVSKPQTDPSDQILKRVHEVLKN